MTPSDKKQLLLRVIAEALGRVRRAEDGELSISRRQEFAVYRTVLDEFLNSLLDAHTPEEINRVLDAMADTIDRLLGSMRP